jgi:hypothetical protein
LLKRVPQNDANFGFGTLGEVEVVCLQRNGALEHGEFAEGAESRVESMPLSILHSLRMAMLG